MITKLAWRNVWRNRTRSLVVIIATALGIFGALFIFSISLGMVDKWIAGGINNELGEFQIHHKQYIETEENKYVFDRKEVEPLLEGNTSLVKSYAFRLKTEAMASSAHNTFQVKLMGIDVEEDQAVFKVHERMVEGVYFGSDTKFKQAVISTRLAEELQLGLGSKLIVNMADPEGTILYENFKIVGLFKTGSIPFDKTYVFVEHGPLARVLGLSMDQYHEAVGRTVLGPQEDQDLSPLQVSLPSGLALEKWSELNPFLAAASGMMDVYGLILIMVVLIALIFGIINTMLMAVLERTREVGMLRSLGMSRPKVARMFITETIFLSLVGALFGNVITVLGVSWAGSVGIEFKQFEEGFEAYGLEAIVHPRLDGYYYIMVTVLVFCTAVLASFFPVRRALKLDPASSIRD